MKETDGIRHKILQLYDKNPVIHVSVYMNRPKISVNNEEALIRGVYPNLFRIESRGRYYTVKYSEIATRIVRIAELEKDIPSGVG